MCSARRGWASSPSEEGAAAVSMGAIAMVERHRAAATLHACPPQWFPIAADAWGRLRKAGVEIGVGAGVITHPRLRQEAARRDEAVDPPLRPLVPADVEGGELWKELQLAVRQVVVAPPRHRLPRRPLRVAIGEPRHDDRGHRADEAVRIAAVPDV